MMRFFCGMGCVLFIVSLSIHLAYSQADNGEIFHGPSADFKHGPIKVSTDHRHFVHADGTPFFWLGDTAWELFHRLNREEAIKYLEDRRSKGFTVIQAVVLADLEGLTVPNPYGDLPLADNDPTKPNELYFRHVDFIVQEAERRGMYIGMLPTWGDKFNKKWGFGPEIFTPENAKWFGEFLGKRYRDKPIVWILGGDRIPETEVHFAVIRAMADGIEKGSGGSQLMTFHPWGENTSSLFFHADSWLDFNMFQSGHVATDLPNYKFTVADYKRLPTKPVVDGEPRYEDHPVKWDPKNGWFDEFDVRQAAYWSMLSGAAGHTYGDNNIWQMWQPSRKSLGHARTPWYEALQHPGSRQMGLMRKLFEAFEFSTLRPAPELLLNNVKEDGSFQCASISEDGSLLIAYTPYGKNISIDTRLKGPLTKASWFNPRNGEYTQIENAEKKKQLTYDPPGKPERGNDWILVLQSVDK